MSASHPPSSSTTTSTTGWDFSTPSVTEDFDYEEGKGDKKGRVGDGDDDAVPWPGNRYVIRARNCGRVITILDKQVQLRHRRCSGDASSHWICEEKDGWLGFRNPVYGKYMGHDGRGRFYAEADHHKGWECFCVRRHPDGGYLLLNRQGGWYDTLLKMAETDAGRKLVHAQNEGILWDFVQLPNPDVGH